MDPSIAIDLRYASARNALGHPLYPPDARALVRQSVAGRLRIAQQYLRERGYGLKILDAYRPPATQRALWDFAHSARFVADPEAGHALHTWGVAVDATVIDARGREVPMPSDFDAFSGQASMHYQGPDPAVRRDLDLLQHAMGVAGFRGMRSEWWHFVAPDWMRFAPVTPGQARDFSARPVSPPPARRRAPEPAPQQAPQIAGPSLVS